MPGLFVTFEGGEGSGKSTQIRRLAEWLAARGREPLVTREPGGTPLAERLREVLLDRSLAPGAESEALMMEAARADLVARVLRPALAAGRVVLCDRYDDSTLAYQGGGRGLDPGWLTRLNAFATGGLTPDLTVLLDLPVTSGLARRAGQGDANRLDLESAEFHERVRAAYHRLAGAEPERFLVLDAGLAPDELFGRIRDAVERRLAARG